MAAASGYEELLAQVLATAWSWLANASSVATKHRQLGWHLPACGGRAD
jgi:hypothetical protein